MTLRQPRCSVSQSISPVAFKVLAPLFGAGVEDVELLGKEHEGQPLAPGGDIEHGGEAHEKGEEEEEG